MQGPNSWKLSYLHILQHKKDLFDVQASYASTAPRLNFSSYGIRINRFAFLLTLKKPSNTVGRDRTRLAYSNTSTLSSELSKPTVSAVDVCDEWK